MTGHTVVIAGGGPTGLMLAGELALARVDVAVVERRESQDLAGLRAAGLYSRTTEVLDQRGIADRFLSEGKVLQSAPFAGRTLDISHLPTRHNYFLALWQTRIERILADWIGELAVPIYRGREVIGFAQDESGVEVELSGGGSLRAQYLVGCDGGRSLIRKKAGIDFPGWDPSTSYLIAEIETTEEPAWGIRRGEKGINAFAKLEGGVKRARVVVNEQHVRHGEEPTIHRAPRGARRRLWDGLWCSQRHQYLQVYRYGAAGSVLPEQTRAPGRRRGACPFACRWSGAECRCPGCGESGVEARPGGPWNIAGEPPGHLSRRAAPRRRAPFA